VVPSEMYSMKATLIKRVKLDKNPSVHECLITTFIHVKDSDEDSLFVKINTGAERVFGSNYPRIDEHIMDAMNRLKNKGINPSISAACIRYPGGYDDGPDDPVYVPPDDSDETTDSDISIEIGSDDDMRIENEGEEEAAAGLNSKKRGRHILRRTKPIQKPRQYWNKKGEPSGVFHFALCGLQGRKKDMWAPTAP
jgi:hypothetical protein